MLKNITIHDIAKKLGISAATVSRALADSTLVKKETKDKILQSAKDLGYRYNAIAGNLRKQNSQTIGILLHEVNSHFVTSVLAGIEKVASAEKYDMLIAHSGEEYQREIANVKNLFSKRVAGLVTSLALNTKDIAHFAPFFDHNIPVVFFDRVINDTDCTKVVIDNFQGGYIATKHLIQQGCTRIAHITANLTRNVYSDRFEGYKKALNEAGLKFHKNLLYLCQLLDRDAVRLAVTQLLKQKPDAFFITNDLAASVCIDTLRKKGIRVPQDIAVFGFNNDVVGQLITPKLSTINYPGATMGEIAARELIKQLKIQERQGKITHKTIIVPSEIIVRESSLKLKI
jgi:LacI family transcriptional regulator